MNNKFQIKKAPILLILITIIFFSCQEKEKQINNSINKENNSNSIKFSSDRIKIFSDFWIDMSHQEFELIKKRLIEKEIMSYDGKYNFNCHSLKLDPFYEDNKLKAITIRSKDKTGDCFYDMYKSKYNLKALNNQRIECDCYKKKNILYYQAKNIYLLDQEIKNTIKLKDRYYNVSIPWENPVIIDKGNIILEIKTYSQTTEDDYTYTYLYGNNKEKKVEGDVLREALDMFQNEKHLYICNVPFLEMSIKYYDKKYFLDLQKWKKDMKLKEQKNLEKLKNEIEKRKKKVYQDI